MMKYIAVVLFASLGEFCKQLKVNFIFFVYMVTDQHNQLTNPHSHE